MQNVRNKIPKLLRVSLLVSVIGGLMVVSGCRKTDSGPPEKLIPSVTVAKPITKNIVEWDAYTGRLEAVRLVEIRARVGGYLQSVHFDEGQIVEKDDLLFVIDPRPFEAELNAAQAQRRQSESRLKQSRAMLNEAKARAAQSESQLNLADVAVQANRSLSERNASSQDELDGREAELMQAKADIEGVNASINSAEAAIATSEAEIETRQGRSRDGRIEPCNTLVSVHPSRGGSVAKTSTKET